MRADGNRVLISIDGGDAKAEAPARPVDASLGKAEPAPAPPVRVAEQKPAPVEAPAAAPAPAAEPAEPAAGPSEPGVVASRIDEKPVKNPARKITAFRVSKGKLQVVTDGEIAKFELIELTDPPRLAVDVYGVKAQAKPKNLHGGALKDVRLGAWPDHVRLVLDVAGEMPAYHATRLSNGVAIALDGPALARAPVQKPAAEPEGAAELEIDGQKIAVEAPVAAPPEKLAPKEITGAAEVKDLAFEEANEGGRVEIKLAGDSKWRVERPDAKSAVLTLESAHLPKKLERSLDTCDLETPVKMVSRLRRAGAGGAGEGGGGGRRADRPDGGALAPGPLVAAEAEGRDEQATVDAKAAGFASERAAVRRARRAAAALRGQARVLRVQGHRHSQPAAHHRGDLEEEHRGRRRRRAARSPFACATCPGTRRSS